MVIRSKDNERVKHARRAREGREPGLIFIEGLRLAEEGARSGLEVRAVFHLAAGQDERAARLLAGLAESGAEMLECSPAVMDTLTDTVRAQGIVLLARRPQAAEPSRPGLVLGLDRIQDPGNLGTLLRTAEAAGADAVALLPGCADVFSPKVLRASMGAAFRLPVIELAGAAALFEFSARHGLQTAAAAGAGERTYDAHDWRAPTLLLLGNEANGVDPALLRQCAARLRIPLARQVESLNVAAAGAVILFEAARQRRARRPG